MMAKDQTQQVGCFLHHVGSPQCHQQQLQGYSHTPLLPPEKVEENIEKEVQDIKEEAVEELEEEATDFEEVKNDPVEDLKEEYSGREIGEVEEKEEVLKSVASSCAQGNELYKSANFVEASTAHGEGLEQYLLNRVLLCDGAACWSKLGQWGRLVEDCNEAFRIHTSYVKAFLRCADSFANLERWNEVMAFPNSLAMTMDQLHKLGFINKKETRGTLNHVVNLKCSQWKKRKKEYVLTLRRWKKVSKFFEVFVFDPGGSSDMFGD